MTKDQQCALDGIRYLEWSYQSEQKKNGFPWGPHECPFVFDFSGASVSVKKSEDGLIYRREGEAGSNEKVILADQGLLLFSPVEPFHTPAQISNHLLVELEKPVVIEPRRIESIMVTFPLEVAAAFSRRKSGGDRVLDIFSFSRSKFTLYGGIRDGFICKYWKSGIYRSIPAVNPLKYGVMRIEIHNLAARWAEVQKFLFSAQGMKIYYNQNLVCLNATMKIGSEVTAETNFLDEPIQKGMNKALEQFSTRLLSLPGRTIMEEGY